MDFGDIFQRFWWLLFPVLSMIWGMIDLSARHRRAREGLQLIKSYIDQGKEPPPELLKFLQASPDRDCGRNHAYGWVPVFLFAALSAAFLMAAYWPGMDWEPRQAWVMHLLAMIFGALCLGMLVTALRNDRDGKPPQ